MFQWVDLLPSQSKGWDRHTEVTKICPTGGRWRKGCFITSIPYYLLECYNRVTLVRSGGVWCGGGGVMGNSKLPEVPSTRHCHSSRRNRTLREKASHNPLLPPFSSVHTTFSTIIKNTSFSICIKSNSYSSFSFNFLKCRFSDSLINYLFPGSPSFLFFLSCCI